MNIEMYNALNGLYTNNLVRHKYKHALTDADLKDIREKNKQSAQDLDILGVPWYIQNAVAYASEQQKNWYRYNQDVINEIIERYSMKGVTIWKNIKKLSTN